MDLIGRSGEMQVFATVAEQGSLSAAARTLGLTPSAVSRSIARTERRLGTRLRLRTTRSITLTAEGEAYLRGAGASLPTWRKSRTPSPIRACRGAACA